MLSVLNILHALRSPAILAMLMFLTACNATSSLQSVADEEAAKLAGKKEYLLAELRADPSLRKVVGGRTDDPAPGFETIVPGSEQDFVLNVGREIYFVEGSANLERNAKETLDLQAAWLLRYPKWKVKIQGHFDDPIPKAAPEPPKEEESKSIFSRKKPEPTPEEKVLLEKNRAIVEGFALSDQRAQATRNYLIEKGVAQNRLLAQGYGRLLPVRDCPEVSCKALNRRVVSSLRVSFDPLFPENL